jgi:RHS repeat-associated protein
MKLQYIHKSQKFSVKCAGHHDMGHDGDVHQSNNIVARDAYGYTLNYFNGDYRSIANTNFQATGLPITSLYNGNIAGATYSIKPLIPKTIGTVYSYDQLNRYVGDTLFKNLDTINNTWSTRTGINDFKEKVSYDENGNILLYLRHGNTMNGGHLSMDSLTYHYTKGRNQLTEVNDAVGSTNYTIDIDNETSKYSYKYNGIGELAKDSAGGLDTIIWTIYGKVKEIKKHNGDSIIFFYDPIGNRLEKRYYPHSSTSDTTMYVRAVNKNILAIYDRKKDTVKLIEWGVYCNKRIAVVDTLMRIQKPQTGAGSLDSLTINYLEGQKQYELANYLGNVLATVSDKKIPVDTITTDTLAKYYLSLVINAQDYYPFGMEEPGRTYVLNGDSSYRFAFNGKEKTNEIYGNSDAYDYGMRMYDPRLGRFMSVDPISNKFPQLSPYQYASNNPILNIDVDGLEGTKSNQDGNDLKLPTIPANFDWKQAVKQPADYSDAKAAANNRPKGSDPTTTPGVYHGGDLFYWCPDCWDGYTGGHYVEVRKPDAPTTTAVAQQQPTAESSQPAAAAPPPPKAAANSTSQTSSTPKPSASQSFGGDPKNSGFILTGAYETTWLRGGDLWSSDQTISRNGDVMKGIGMNQVGDLLNKIAAEVNQRNDITSINVDITLRQTNDGAIYTAPAMNLAAANLKIAVTEYLRKVGGVSNKVSINVKSTYKEEKGKTDVNVSTK